MAVRGRDARMPRDSYVNGGPTSSNKPAFSLILVFEGRGKGQTCALRIEAFPPPSTARISEIVRGGVEKYRATVHSFVSLGLGAMTVNKRAVGAQETKHAKGDTLAEKVG
jgi:hypothetical protein